MRPELRIRRLSPSWNSDEGRAFCSGLQAFCAGLPAETVIEGRRNHLFRIHIDVAGRQEIVIKRFAVPHPLGRLLNTLRSSKALRSFDIAVRLLDLGVSTPEPLAAVETWKGLRTGAFYCCRWHTHWSRARELRADFDPRAEHATWALGVFIGHLHNLGVLHRDLSGGNVLVGGDPSTPFGVTFSLIDLNRIRFTSVGRRMGIANLAVLGHFHYTAQLLDGYCRERRLSPSWTCSRYETMLGVRRLRDTIWSGTRPLRRTLGL